jgi:hypothetical protein
MFPTLTLLDAYRVLRVVGFLLPPTSVNCFIPKQGAYGLVLAGREMTTKKKIAIKKIGNFADDLLDGMRILREVGHAPFCPFALRYRVLTRLYVVSRHSDKTAAAPEAYQHNSPD